MEHYKYIEKKYGKTELEELIYNAITGFFKSYEGQKLKKFIDEQMTYNLPAMDVFTRLMSIQDKVIHLSKVRK